MKKKRNVYIAIAIGLFVLFSVWNMTHTSKQDSECDNYKIVKVVIPGEPASGIPEKIEERKQCY